MLKLTKKADYGLIAMRHLAEILQRLTKAGLLASQYGTNGGYTLARNPRHISAFEVIRAIDGPLFITSCSAATADCEQSDRCTVREPLRKVSRSIEEVLNRLTIWEMTEPEHDSAPELVTLGWTTSKAHQV